MRYRSSLAALLLIGFVVPFVGCVSSPSLTSISVTPTTMNFGGPGLQTQLTAIGSYTHPNHPAITKDITSQVNWASSATQCVTVSSTGLITSGSNVCSNILVTASMQGFNGLISNSMTVNVTQPTGGGGSSDITSIAIIPPSRTVASLNQTTQFIAIGSTAGGVTVDLTTAATWSSSDTSIASVTNSGLAKALAAGTTTITALFTNADHTVATGTATLVVAPSGSPEPLVALSIVPASQTATSVNETAQFIAIGTTGSGTTVDLTSTAKWSSSDVTVASIDATTGLAKALSSGTTAITAIATNPDKTVVTGSAALTVTISASQEPLISLEIIPTSQSVSTPGETSQFIAIGTFSGTNSQNTSICNGTGTLQDCTNYVTWNSSDVKIATISKNGLATGLDLIGTTAITAIGHNPDGTVVTGVATFSQGLIGTGPVLQSTLGVTLIGTGAANGLVTAPAPGTTSPLVINCTAAQGSVCTQPFPVGSTVTLTATPQAGAVFGGWSVNCSDPNPINPTGANTCTIPLPNNETVAAIFYAAP